MNKMFFIFSQKETEKHLELLDGVLLDLVHKKWKTFCKLRFIVEFSLFFLYYALASTTVILKRSYFNYLKLENCTNSTEDMTTLLESCKCAYLYPKDPNKYVI